MFVAQCARSRFFFVEAKPTIDSDSRIGDVKGTSEQRINGDTLPAHCSRVLRNLNDKSK